MGRLVGVAERVHLEEQSLRLRAYQAVVFWLAFLVMVFMGTGSWIVVLAGCALLALCAAGFYGATPEGTNAAGGGGGKKGARGHRFEVNEGLVAFFRAGLLAWTGAAVVGVAAYLIFHTVDDVVEDRCAPSNLPFVELFGSNCTTNMDACEDACVAQVRVHLIVEASLVTIGTAVALLVVAAQAQTLLDDKQLIEADSFELPSASASS